MIKMRRLVAGTAAVLALAGVPAVAAAASSTASSARGTTEKAGLPVRVLHERLGHETATFTVRGRWKLSHVKFPQEHLLRPRQVRQGTKGADATADAAAWSGYVDTPKGNTTFDSVTAYFNIPNLNCASSTPGPDGAWYADWAGLDGWTSSTVEQEGIESTCTDGSEAGPYVFYEMFPAAPVGFTGAAPGDALQTTTTYNPSTQKYTLKVTDLTQSGAGVTETIACATTCDNSSAEVISEAPGGGSPNYGLADFGAESYTNAGIVTGIGTTGGFASSDTWNSSKINMVSSSTGDSLATAGLLSGGTSFMVRWVKSL
jgi:hypothetical protein